jgi:hypothetical protein
MEQVLLADLEQKKGITPNYPCALDTEFDFTSRVDLDRVSDPCVVDALVKVHAFFMPHIVVQEAQILDHLGRRRFFGLLESKSELIDALRYFVDPGKDRLEMGPLVLASERYSTSASRHPFPLEQLLARKLGADDPGRHPWELSSFWEANGGQKRDEARRQVREANPSRRLAIAKNLLEPADAYDHYLKQASEIWDKRADVTRLPLPAPDYAGKIARLLAQGGAYLDQRESEIASELVNSIRSGSLEGLGEGINRSTVHQWLRRRQSGRVLDDLATRANPEAFVSAFPDGGWASIHEPRAFDFWVTGERSSKPKRPLGSAVAKAMDGLACKRTAPDVKSLILRNVKYADLQRLRADEDFQASLVALHTEWRYCRNQDHVATELIKHMGLAWKVLGYDKRSSPATDGPSLAVEVYLRSVDDVVLGIGINDLLHKAGLPNVYAITVGPLFVLVKNIVRLKSRDSKAAMLQLAKRIAANAKIELSQKDSSRGASHGGLRK